MPSQNNKNLKTVRTVLFLLPIFVSISLVSEAKNRKDSSVLQYKNQVKQERETAREERLKSEKLIYKHERGTFYLRIGGGFHTPGRNIFGSDSKSYIFGEGFIKTPPTIPTSGDAFGGLMNIAFGFNIYSRGFFHFGMELSADLNFGLRQSIAHAAYIDETGLTDALSSVLMELKFRFGVNIKTGPVRVVPYITFGAATNIMHGIAYKFDFATNPVGFVMGNNDSVHALFGATYGLGIMVNSRRYPIGFYAELTFPTLITTIPGQLEITPESIGIPSVTPNAGIKTEFISGIAVIFAPRFAAGIQIGF